MEIGGKPKEDCYGLQSYNDGLDRSRWQVDHSIVRTQLNWHGSIFTHIEDIDGDKKVLKITKEGKIIAVYDSINDVMNQHSSYTYSGIYGCICGRRQTYRGYIFKYKKDLLNG